MIKKLARYGNSLALIIDKPILVLLNIKETTPLKIRTDGQHIILEPVHEHQTYASSSVSNDEKLQKAYEELSEQYALALKRLADN